jgi:hypothetical protein
MTLYRGSYDSSIQEHWVELEIWHFCYTDDIVLVRYSDVSSTFFRVREKMKPRSMRRLPCRVLVVEWTGTLAFEDELGERPLFPGRVVATF